MKKGIIFDLDGTLWDSCAAMTKAWNIRIGELYPECAAKVREEEARAACGLPMDRFWKQVFREVFDQIPAAQQEALIMDCDTYEVTYLREHGGKLYPGVAEVFEKLSKEYHLFVVSNCQRDYAYAFASWSGMDRLLDDIEEYGRTGKYKTENILDVIRRNKLDQAIYVGDTSMDGVSSREAGIPFVFAQYGFGDTGNITPAATIGSLYELEAAAEKIFGQWDEQDIIWKKQD